MNKGDNNMWRNDLEKFNFNMDTLRVFDVFSGIGALHKSLKKLGIPVKITNISEIDCDAIISYAGVHINNFKDLEFKYPSVEEMREFLIGRNIGYSYEKDKSSIPRMKVDKLKLVYKASVLLNNLGDISTINYREIEDFDLMNFSFSCTDLSNAGKQKGMRNEDGTSTRSGLYVYGIKAIREKKPKYIMIENVKGLIQKKFIDDFYSIVNELDEIGYNCYYPTKEDKKGSKIPTCLNAKDFGIPQNRERIYVICIRKDIDDNKFEFPIGRDFGIRLKDMLEDNVDEKYYLSEEIQKRFKPNNKPDTEHNEINTVGTSAPDYKQPKQILESNDILQLGNIVNTGNWDNPQRGRIYSSGGISPTLNCCGGGGLEPKIVEKCSEQKIRKLTPLECWRLMGFDDEDIYNAQELGISDSQLYKQAGNSIVVNVLYYIFKNLFKEYINLGF